MSPRTFSVRLLAWCILFVPPANAVPATLRPGLEVGVNRATVRSQDGGGDSNPYAPHYGLLAGGFLALRFNDHVALRAHLLFSRKGAEIPADPETTTIDYLDLPLLVELRPFSHGPVRPYSVFGASASRELRVRSSQAPGVDLGDSIQDIDFGAIVGAGVGVGRVTVEARYTIGLRNIREADFSGEDLRNRALSVSLGLSF